MNEVIETQKTLRRRLTAEQKMAIVQASYVPGVIVAEIARKYHIGLSSLLKWRQLAIGGSLMSVKDNEPAASAGEVKKLKKRIAQLEQILGKKSLQVDLLKDAIEIAREKKLISRQPLPGIDDIAAD